MVNRGVEIAGFLAQHGWDGADYTPFDADFSSRRYARLTHQDGRVAIFMDADPSQKTDKFIAIARLLRGVDIQAPQIYAADPLRGLVLLEDFGHRNVGGLMDAGGDPMPLYRRAVDVLVTMHKKVDVAALADLHLPVYNEALFIDQASWFLDFFIPHRCERDATQIERDGFNAAWCEVLAEIETWPQNLLLRDFMPDNLMDVPGQENLGVLDFQDAGVGPSAYDLASLCEVVRRDVGNRVLDQVVTYYYERAEPDMSFGQLLSVCRILSAQRHVRILGNVARLAQMTGRRDKLVFVPRIQKYLDELLRDKTLGPVRVWVEPYLAQ